MGHWEPHTSSIDFCESNYLHSPYIVELHNTWSSIVGITLFGIIGLYYGNHTNELRFRIAYTILIVIGIGSAFLHATLDWKYQSSDELPMIYLMLSFIYIRLELYSPMNKPTYPNLPLYLIILSIGNTFIYYTFQELYMVFIVTYSLAVLIYIIMITQLMRNKEHRKVAKNPIARQLCKLATGTYLLIATPVWLFDMFYCQVTLDYIASHMSGMTPHVIWHFVAGYGAYCTIVYLECFRMESLGMRFHDKYLLGFIPVIVHDDDHHNYINDNKKNSFDNKSIKVE